MILNTSSFSIQENNVKDIGNSNKKIPSLNDLMLDQNIANKKTKTVHHRRDLDSLG